MTEARIIPDQGLTREYTALLHDGDDAESVQNRMISIGKAAGVTAIGVSDVRRTDTGWSVQITMGDAKDFRLFDDENVRIANASEGFLPSNVYCFKCNRGHKRGACQ